MPSTHNCQPPQWLRQRVLGKCQRGVQASTESMRRLQLESCLEGHSGCVNCLEWNRSGDLLASGSDDHNVIIWDPFRGVKRNIIKTGHQGNIFSVKFVPDFSDTIIATCASDSEVKLINILANENVMNCKSCHIDRVKRLAVHPNEPHLLWSAGEEGYIMQYDIREEHNCKPSKPKNLLIDLKTAGLSLSAKCLAINPMRDEMLAVGANDAYIRLFDRRYMCKNGWNSCTAYFTPGHLLKTNRKSSPRTSGTTYLSFSPDGAELLANMQGEQVYLFNTYEPWERYKSFEGTAKPLILDLPTITTANAKSKIKTYSEWQELKKFHKPVDLPEKYRDFYQELNMKLKTKISITKEDFDKMNTLLAETQNCLELYHLRAGALIQRGWRGDYYQAIRDCCCAFALNPIDYSSLVNFAFASYYMGDKDATSGLHEIMKIVQQEFDAQDKGLQQAAQALAALIRDNSSHTLNSWTVGVRWANHEDNTSVQTDNQDDPMLDNSVLSLYPHFDTTYLPRMFIGDTDSSTDLQDITNMFNEQTCKENQRSLDAFDFTKRFCGHCNMTTDIKEVNFFGYDGEFIVGGSDDGAFYIWDKHTTNIVKAVHGDMQILNCLQPHPNICMLATSGIEPLVKLWSPSGKTCQDVKSLDLRCYQNQDYITSDPLEAMIMMLYPDRDI